MSARETLIAARDLISDKKRYAPGAYARDANGNAIATQGDASDASDERAKAWNAFGAVWRCSEPTRESRYDAIGLLAEARARHLKRSVSGDTRHFHNEVDAWLDNAPHHDVISIFNAAIEASS